MQQVFPVRKNLEGREYRKGAVLDTGLNGRRYPGYLVPRPPARVDEAFREILRPLLSIEDEGGLGEGVIEQFA